VLITKFQSRKFLRGSTKKNIGSKHKPMSQNMHVVIKLTMVKSFSNPRKKKEPKTKETIIKIPRREFLKKIVLSL